MRLEENSRSIEIIPFESELITSGYMLLLLQAPVKYVRQKLGGFQPECSTSNKKC